MNEPAQTMPWDVHLRDDVDRAITKSLGLIEHPGLKEMLEHATSGGKRIRPLLTIFSCAAVGGRSEDAVPAAAALELLHASSLVHDDIMDNAVLRRGKPAVHLKHGTPRAILAGDALIALAYRLIGEARTLDPLGTLATFSNCFIALCEGQCADIESHEGLVTDPSQHRWMVERKTARLAEACTRIGAMAGTRDTHMIDALGRFGLHLGLAYQATDDLLDATGDETVTGKSTGRDSENGRLTYLTMAYPETDRIMATRSIIADHTAQALRALLELPRSDARDRLQNIAFALLDRDS
jgi:geranylgeranyl diphosphate synthase, type I